MPATRRRSQSNTASKKKKKPEPRVKHRIVHEVTFNGRYKDGNYGSFYATKASAKREGQRVYFEVQCQKLSVQFSDLKEIVALAQKDISLPKGAKTGSVKLAVTAKITFKYNGSNGGNQTGEVTKEGKDLLFDIRSNRYKFKATVSDFVKVIDLLGEEVQIVKKKSKSKDEKTVAKK